MEQSLSVPQLSTPESPAQHPLTPPDTKAAFARPPLSLSQITLACHGISPEGRPTLYVNNNTGAEVQNGVDFPFDVVPDPKAVVPLLYYTVPALKSGEYALTLPLPAGFVDYYVARGLISSAAQVVEVNPLDGGFGYPHADPLAVLRLQNAKLPPQLQGSHVLCTFPSSQARMDTLKAGGTAVQFSSPARTSNKADLRRVASTYGIPMSLGISVTGPEAVDQALRQFSEAPRLWIKLAHGAGGDTVIPLAPPYSRNQIEGAIGKLRHEVQTSFVTNTYGDGALQQYWAHESYAPVGTTVLIEADAGMNGQVIENSAAMVSVDRNGRSQILAYTRQITDGGTYLGNESTSPAGVLKDRIDSMLQAVATMYHQEHGYAGIFGVDYLVVRDQFGQDHPVVIEANGRPINSTYAAIVAEKIGAEHWINAKLTCSLPLSSFQDVEKLLVDSTGKNYAWQTDVQQGVVIPTIIDSLQTKNESGEYQVTRPGSSCRVLIGSSVSIEHCRAILSELKESFNRRPPVQTT